MVKKAKEHSNVCYIYYRDSGFKAIEKAKRCNNGYGIDLFTYDGNIYEGRTGVKFMDEADLPYIDSKLKRMGGLEKFDELVQDMLKKIGESPRYTRPDELKKDIFPPIAPDPEKENIVLAKDAYGKKHYYMRFDYEGFELFTLKNATEFYRQVYVRCDGFMIGVGQHQNLDTIKKWLEEIKNDVKGEIEKQFNESLSNPQKWADIGYANILGRVEEAHAHNAPIQEAREQKSKQQDEERKAKWIAEEQAIKEEYETAIKTAENKIVSKQPVSNTDIQGKSLIMQLFREHDITVPLKTQGWTIKALHSIWFDEQSKSWTYSYFKSSRDSTVFSDYLNLLVNAVHVRQEAKNEPKQS